MKHALALLTLALTAAFAVAPAITEPFTGFRPDQLPIPQTDPPIQPAGWAFSIWGLIYGWLIVSAVFGVLRRGDDPDWDRVRAPLAVTLAVGTAWLAIANASAIWATITIAIMAAGAIAALIRSPAADRWWLRAPVAVLAGWLTAATFVSLGATAAGHGLFAGPAGWAVIGILAALAIALAVLRAVPGATEYALTLVWALGAIAIKNAGALPVITALAVAGAVVLLAVAALGLRRSAAA